MPKSRIGRVRRTEKQWTEIVRRFEASGEASRPFCRREGVPLSSLQRWRRRLGPASAGRFVELVPPSSPEIAAANWSLDVSLPNGVSLRFRG
jgi:hypothetical protein